MSIWKPDPVHMEPDVELYRWSVIEVSSPLWEGTSRHFVGCDHRGGRASSAIQSFDPETKIGITKSGRKYKLNGSSGLNLDAGYVWGTWCEINQVSESVDVSEEYE